MKYDVFISYSRADSAVADRICEAFDKAGVSYFIDRQGIGGGFEFPVVLAEAIVESKVVLFLASKSSYESKFTNAELTFAFNEKPKNSILPYIIDGSTMPPALRFVFSSINWRTIESHPIESTLVDDILKMLGRDAESALRTKAEEERKSKAKAAAEEEARRKAEEQSRLREEKIRREEAEKQLRREQRQVRIEKIKKHAGAIVASILLIIGVIAGFVVIKDWAAERKRQQIEAQTYKIGDYYNDGTKEGVVFYVDATGKHGKIVSLTQTNLQWCTDVQYDKEIVVGATSKTDGKANTDKVMARADSREYTAFVWCRNMGKSWYLPAIKELKLLLLNDSVHDAVNKTLESRGAGKLYKKGTARWYWSSTEYADNPEFCAWSVSVGSGGPSGSGKYNDSYVRAVSAF